MREQLNKIFFVTSLGIFLLNAVFFSVVFILAITVEFFPEPIKSLSASLSGSDRSLQKSLFLTFLGFAGVLTVIYARVGKYFLCWWQGLRASIGTTVAAIMLYACVWSLIQVGKGSQSFVALHPSLWDLGGIINNVKYGSLLLLFSAALSMLGSLLIPQPSFDFTALIHQWNDWKGPVRKLRRDTGLTEKEHERLQTSTAKMLEILGTITGYMQPVARKDVAELSDLLGKFQAWYTDKTSPGWSNCRGLDDEILQNVDRILNLC